MCFKASNVGPKGPPELCFFHSTQSRKGRKEYAEEKQLISFWRNYICEEQKNKGTWLEYKFIYTRYRQTRATRQFLLMLQSKSLWESNYYFSKN